jgi:hypothetical protein
VPRIVSRALRGTSGITSLMDDGDPSGCVRTSDSTDLGAGAGNGDSEFGAPSVAAGAEVGSVLNPLMPTQLSSTATAPRISSSAPLLKRRRTGARGGPFEIIFTRITSPGVDGVPDWDLAAATEVACNSIVFATAVCGTEGSAEAGRSAAGSGIADRPSVTRPTSALPAATIFWTVIRGTTKFVRLVTEPPAARSSLPAHRGSLGTRDSP